MAEAGSLGGTRTGYDISILLIDDSFSQACCCRPDLIVFFSCFCSFFSQADILRVVSTFPTQRAKLSNLQLMLI